MTEHVLVTGGAGYIGGAAVRLRLQHGYLGDRSGPAPSLAISQEQFVADSLAVQRACT